MNHITRSIVLTTILCAWSTTATADVFYDTYQRGLAAFKAKDYTNARSDFLRAYDLRPEPIILFNVGQTYRLELSSEQALIYYKRFLSESKIAEDLRSEAQAYVAELEAERIAQDKEREREANAGPTERDGTPAKLGTPPIDRLRAGSATVAPSDSVAERDNKPVELPEPRNRPRDKSTARRPAPVVPATTDRLPATSGASSTVVPLVLSAGALALLSSGVGFELWAESKYAAAKFEMMNQSRRESFYNAANTNRHVAAALAAGGLAAGGAALWLYLRDRNRECDATTNASLHIVPTGIGFALSRQF